MVGQVPGTPLSTATLRGQEFIARLLERSPPGVAQTFTTEQLETIKQVFIAAGYTSQDSSDDEWQQAGTDESKALTDMAPQAAHAFPGERRRPGRSEYIHPSLISLLRHPIATTEADYGDDDIRPAQGLVTAVLLSLPILILVGIVVGLLLLR
jgi:hypothetical protein